MSLVLIMAKLTPQAMQAWHEHGVTKRAADVSAMMESIGGSVVSYYAADGGEWDNVGVFQFPDDWSHAAMIRFLHRAYSAGAHVKLQHIYLATPEDVDAVTPPQVRTVTDR